MIDRLLQDLRYALRALRRSPGFATGVFLTLALALGTATSIFTVLERVVLNPLPYPDSDRLIRVEHQVPRVAAPSFPTIPLGLYFLYGDRARTLESIAAYRRDAITITGTGEPERVAILWTTPSLQSVLRTGPERGRWFSDGDAVPGAPRVALLSHGFWMRRYGGSETIVGQSITLSGVPTTVIGVMPASFAFPDPEIQIWAADQITRASGFGLFTHQTVARLRAGVLLEDSRTEMNGLIAQLPQVYSGNALATSLAREHMRSTAVGLKDATIANVTPMLWSLMIAAALVLAVACANITNLFMVRSELRRTDAAVRLALGANRAAVARTGFVESVLLCLASGTASLAIASAAVRLLVAAAPRGLPRLDEISIDGRVLLFAGAASVLASFVFGLIPALYYSPAKLSLRHATRGAGGSRVPLRARQVLIGGQIALALLLVIASGLMVRCFQNLRAVDPGFDVRSQLTFRIELPANTYPTRTAVAAGHQRILDELATIPGVTSAAAVTRLPLSNIGGFGNAVAVPGRSTQNSQPLPAVMFMATSGDYMNTLRMRVLEGQTFRRAEVDRQEPVVVVNKAFVDAYFPGEDALNRLVSSSVPPPLTAMPLRIIGIVANTPFQTLAEMKPAPMLYMPMTIAGGPDIPAARLVGPNVNVMSYVVRTADASPLAIVAAVRRAIAGIDPTLAVANVETLQQVFDRAIAQTAFTMTLLLLAAAIALLLGLVGVYAVTSYVVAQRTSEIGVRMAIGANPLSIATMIVSQGARVALVGAALGVAIALATTRLMTTLLYGVSPRDGMVFSVTPVIVIAVALAAYWLPARRASRVDPVIALRAE
jgi:predicted permease